MADTGLKLTGAVVDAGTWTNCTTTRLNTSDDLRATAVSTTFLTALLNNYAFGIPAGATINGIEIAVEMSRSAYTGTLQLSLSWDNGGNYTATKSDTATSSTDATKTFGGPTDTWGRSWSQAEFADGTFKVKMEGKNSNASESVRVDLLQIKVYYTEAGGGVIAKINNETIANISKLVRDVPIANIAKINNLEL